MFGGFFIIQKERRKQMITINVNGFDLNYKRIDGNIHCLSANKGSRVMGLCVMQKDYDDALRDAQKQIKELLEKNKLD